MITSYLKQVDSTSDNFLYNLRHLYTARKKNETNGPMVPYCIIVSTIKCIKLLCLPCGLTVTINFVTDQHKLLYFFGVKDNYSKTFFLQKFSPLIPLPSIDVNCYALMFSPPFYLFQWNCYTLTRFHFRLSLSPSS